MKLRLPLWITLLPLLAGGLGWWTLWRAQVDHLRTDIARLLPPDTVMKMGGFPYRLQAVVDDFHLARQWPGVSVQATASELTVHRVPWQHYRQVLTLREAAASLGVPALPDLAARLDATSAIASLHIEEGRIARLSIVWENPQAGAAFLPAGSAAAKLETHFRITPPAAGVANAEIVVDGTNLHFGAGSPLGLSLRATIRPGAHGLAGWQQDGRIIIEGLEIADSQDVILRFSGELRPDSHGLQAQGTLTTLCPATLRAALAGERAAPEKRARKAQELTIAGHFPAQLSVAGADDARLPVRGQEADCPQLR